MQIGNAIEEKKVLDVLLAARDRGLYHAVTDCGAGGFQQRGRRDGRADRRGGRSGQSAAEVRGLSYTEIWISEAQERMVLAVPEDAGRSSKRCAESEGVEATVIGRFVPTGRLQLRYRRPAGRRPGHEVSARRPAAGGAAGGCIKPRPLVADRTSATDRDNRR